MTYLLDNHDERARQLGRFRIEAKLQILKITTQVM